MEKTRIVELIYTTEKVGEGGEHNPVRYVHQLWTKDGRLIAQQDTWQKESYFEWVECEGGGGV